MYTRPAGGDSEKTAGVSVSRALLPPAVRKKDAKGSDDMIEGMRTAKANKLQATARVIIESPYAGLDRDIERNLQYLRACLRDSLSRGEAPYASHGLYTQAGVLDDSVPHERARGIAAGFAWRAVADLTAIYTDLGVTSGMRLGIEHSVTSGVRVEYRELGARWRR